MKTCLNCFFEPDWSEWGSGPDGRRSGQCKWTTKYILPTLPKSFTVVEKNIVMYKDNSGVFVNCPCWTKKMRA